MDTVQHAKQQPEKTDVSNVCLKIYSSGDGVSIGKNKEQIWWVYLKREWLTQESPELVEPKLRMKKITVVPKDNLP